MSASDKKKLRAADRAEKLTEKQQAEQKEAKKLKLYTRAFVVILALMICFAAYTAVTRTIEGSGIREKNTVAVTVGNHEISNAELNYFYIDGINQFYNTYGAYASLLGLDVTKPLNEQVVNEETGTTWADDFIDSAVENAKAVYALNDAATAAGFTLSEDDQAEIDSIIENAAMYAQMYGYEKLDDYLKAMYGFGADEKGYRSYFEKNYIADAYQNAYAEALSYEDADLREAEAEDYNAYSSYSYNYYYLNASSFVDAPSDVATSDYTEDQIAQGVKDAEAAAKAIVAEDINTTVALDKVIAKVAADHAGLNTTSSASKDILSGSISNVYADWITDASRKAGDMNYFPFTSSTTDENGNSTTVTNGYYVVMFVGSTDNNVPMSNVRHILVSFEGGTTDPTTGTTTYTDDEKAAAKAEAEAILNEWKSGAATEESFAALANEKSDDGNGTTGGLYEDINPSTNFVENFKNWALAEHKAGDTDIVETEYGYHIMFYSGDSEQTYRDYMIENDLRTAAINEWYNGLLEATSATVADTKYINTGLVLSSN